MKSTAKKKLFINNMITLGMVVAAWIIMEVLMGTGHVSSLLKGLLVPFCIYVIMAVSLNLTVGILGELSLGHAGFMCVGAFSGALFSKCMKGAIDPTVSLVIAIFVGAAVAAVFGILVLKLNGGTVSLMAVFSGLLVSVLIYFLSQGGGFSNARLILTGIGMQAFLSAVISWMLLKASEYDVANALRWLSGSLNGVKLENVPRLALVVFGAGGAILLLNRQLSMLQLGEAHAVTLGVNVRRIRLTLILLALLLVAFATSVTGPVASVAFLSGPIATRLSGNGKNGMLTSALTGSTLVLASDLIGQFALPSRYPVGVVTGILGAPYLLFLLLQMNDKGEHV